MSERVTADPLTDLACAVTADLMEKVGPFLGDPTASEIIICQDARAFYPQVEWDSSGGSHE